MLWRYRQEGAFTIVTSPNRTSAVADSVESGWDDPELGFLLPCYPSSFQSSDFYSVRTDSIGTPHPLLVTQPGVQVSCTRLSVELMPSPTESFVS